MWKQASRESEDRVEESGLKGGEKGEMKKWRRGKADQNGPTCYISLTEKDIWVPVYSLVL